MTLAFTCLDLPWDGGAVASNLTRKCEALAVSGLVEYGDEIDVIAPADILKQIFKMPYSKARLSIAVYRIGQALVLSTGYVLGSFLFAVKKFSPIVYHLHFYLCSWWFILVVRCHGKCIYFLDLVGGSVGLMLKREKNWLGGIKINRSVQNNLCF